MGSARGMENATRQANAEAWAAVLRTEQGRRVLRQIVYGICGLERDDYDNSAKLHFMQGRRGVGADLMRLMQAMSPAAFAKFHLERAQEEALRVENQDPEKETDP